MSMKWPEKTTRRRSGRVWLVTLVVLIVCELTARQFVARPNRMLRHSRDRDMVFENVPGVWLGHATYDVWKAPIYMVLDLVNRGPVVPSRPPPAGYTIYRIDADGCRLPASSTAMPGADVVVIGSSMTFGLFVPAEDTMPVMLENRLRAGGFPGVRVANCGVVGHHLVPGLRTAELELDAKRPRLFVFLVRPWHLTEQFDYTEVLTPKIGLLRRATETSGFVRLIYYMYRRESTQFDEPVLTRARLESRVDSFLRRATPAGARSIFFLLTDGNPEDALFADVEAVLRQRGQVVERVPMSTSRDQFVDHEQHWGARGAAQATTLMLDSVARELRRAP